MSSKITSIAIIGSGNIGSFILSALVAQTPPPSTLIVLTRDPTKKLPPGAKAVKVQDYEDVDAVAGIFTEYKIDAVLSTVGWPGIKSQYKMADAARKAGVKLFAPSEFGTPDGAPIPSFQEKDKVSEYIESIGLPQARFYTGGFISSLIPITGVRVNGKINIIGKGQSPVSFTAEEDIGGFVAYVLTSLTVSSLSNKKFRLQGDRATLTDIAKWYNKEIAYVEAVPGPGSENLSMLSKLFESGGGSTGWNFELGKEGEGEEAAGSANQLWPEHEWKKIRDVITKLEI
ncbi:NAD(P)-binding protein [Gymnopus androsaceus JB14]|uniref:NAD(P)-binding protein n=1 Tax=Gymnopus androsaceus JB14 TaxID=1447944 RepID=A0A6A4I399_9AGAR|nr:NAD(P)-binding protein [Gymnopus androsaceus JB14]